MQVGYFIKIGKYDIDYKTIILYFGFIVFGGVIFHNGVYNNIYYYERLVKFFNSFAIIAVGKWKSTFSWLDSGQIRLISIFETIRIIIDRPLLGIGLGTNSSHSSLLMTVASIGIVGVSQWFIFFFGWAKRKLSQSYLSFILDKQKSI